MSFSSSIVNSDASLIYTYHSFSKNTAFVNPYFVVLNATDGSAASLIDRMVVPVDSVYHMAISNDYVYSVCKAGTQYYLFVFHISLQSSKVYEFSAGQSPIAVAWGSKLDR